MEFVHPIYDKKDIPRFKKALSKQVNGNRNLLLFEIGLQTALRPSDLLALRKKDVVSGVIKRRASKTGKELEIRLNDRVFEMTKMYVEFMDDEDKLFPINRSSVYRFMAKAARDIGLEENIGAHSIRKTKAYHLYHDKEKDIALVMELLQHDDAGDTLSYIGVKRENLNKELATHDL